VRASRTRWHPRADTIKFRSHEGGDITARQQRNRLRQLRTLGAFGEQIAAKVIGTRNSEITVANGELESFTALVDLSREVVGNGDFVSLDLRSSSVLGIPSFYVTVEHL
jgi:hypothetical protein